MYKTYTVDWRLVEYGLNFSSYQISIGHFVIISFSASYKLTYANDNYKGIMY